MKGISRYMILVLQILIIIVLVYQFEGIDQHGRTIKLATKIDFLYENDFGDHTNVYVEYDINKITDEQWKISAEVDYKERLYVTLVENQDDVFVVKEVAKAKPNQKKEDEVIVQASFNYKDEVSDFYYLTYGFEYLEAIDKFGRFNEGDELVVTISLGKLGQQKITNIVAQ